MHTITCQDCSAERTARNRNTKYCDPCRLLRNLQYIGSKRVHHCHTCEAKFRPASRNDDHCGDCGVVYTRHRGECAVCHHTNAPLYRQGMKLCFGCLYDPKKRSTIIKGLLKGQAGRLRVKAAVHA